MVVGDSIVERQWLFELCGPVLNAGIGSATTADFAGRVSAIVAAARPARVVVNLGINDHGRGVPEGIFAERYSGILNEIGDLPTLIVGVPGRHYENSLRKLGRTYLPWPDVETHDGVHLTAQGAEQWQAAVRGAACPTR